MENIVVFTKQKTRNMRHIRGKNGACPRYVYSDVDDPMFGKVGEIKESRTIDGVRWISVSIGCIESKRGRSAFRDAGMPPVWVIEKWTEKLNEAC